MSIHVDIESFSTAGYVWDAVGQKWLPPEGSSTKKGLNIVGVINYARHPSARVVCLAWDDNIWWPGDPPPLKLWQHVRAGGIIDAWNTMFELNLWNACLVKQGWPELTIEQMRDGQPRARAWGLPAALDKAGKVLQLDIKKDTDGKRLMKLFSMPRNPSAKDRRIVTMPAEDPAEAKKYGDYCLTDVVVETDLLRVLPELSDFEFKVWQCDQRVNARGIPVDMVAVGHATELMRQGECILNAELATITDGKVTAHSLCAQLTVWCNERGAKLVDMKSDTVTECLERDDLDPGVRRSLEIRQTLSSVSCKKVHAFRLRTHDGRIHDQTVYMGAERTGRWAAYGAQVQNMPRGLPDWTPAKTEGFLTDIACRDYGQIAAKWGDPFKALSSSVRGLIKAPPGYRLITADYSAIEAVVLAVLSGEQWRIDVFKGDGKIYEASASAITGTSVAEYAAYKAKHGKHHPDRGGLGKVAELASGYHGGVGAWLNFGAADFFTPQRCEEHRKDWEGITAWKRSKGYKTQSLQDFVIGKQVKAWRKASPMIVKFWDEIGAAAVAAVKSPGSIHRYRDISYQVEHGTLYCLLPSGRRLAYHNASVIPGRFGGDAIQFYGWNTDPKRGAIGWVPLNTYSGKLTENICQAVARDILANAYLEAEAAGYDTIFSVHDELITEMMHGRGTLAGLIAAMLRLPKWAEHYPLRAAGWVDDRFQK